MENYVGRAFTARIRSVGDGLKGTVNLSPTAVVGRGGWLLISNNSERGSVFKFVFLGGIVGRLHYAIYGSDDSPDHAGASLGVSTNGYLGLYKIASVENFWKIEVRSKRGVNHSERFWLRTEAGHRVAAKPLAKRSGTRYGGQYATGDHSSYLNANAGAIAEFELFDVTPIE